MKPATIQDELTYQNFPKEYKLIVARIVTNQIPITNFDIREKLFNYLTKHE